MQTLDSLWSTFLTFRLQFQQCFGHIQLTYCFSCTLIVLKYIHIRMQGLFIRESLNHSLNQFCIKALIHSGTKQVMDLRVNHWIIHPVNSLNTELFRKTITVCRSETRNVSAMDLFGTIHAGESKLDKVTGNGESKMEDVLLIKLLCKSHCSLFYGVLWYF